jgi:hypothetical protein
MNETYDPYKKSQNKPPAFRDPNDADDLIDITAGASVLRRAVFKGGLQELISRTSGVPTVIVDTEIASIVQDGIQES